MPQKKGDRRGSNPRQLDPQSNVVEVIIGLFATSRSRRIAGNHAYSVEPVPGADTRAFEGVA